MDGAPFASMYIGEEVAFIDFHEEPIVLPLPASRFENGRTIADQTTEDLEKILREICLFQLERKLGYLPSGNIEVKELLDKEFGVMVYEAYYSP